jgi:hypothetical protein
LLPASKYEVSYSPQAGPDVTARHYVSFVRQQFFFEGLRRLQPVLFA